MRFRQDVWGSFLSNIGAPRHTHTHTSPPPPIVAVVPCNLPIFSLENRQRHKIEEQGADLARSKAEIASLKRDHERLLAENGRFSDVVGELQSQLQSVSVQGLGHGGFAADTMLIQDNFWKQRI